MTKNETAAYIKQFLIAHRGFHDNQADCPENSMQSFRNAVERGYGIELDVHFSKDEQLVVIHDGELNRICGVDKKVCDLTYEQLRQYPLFDSQERIPLLQDALDVVNGQVPFVIEIKVDDPKQRGPLCEAVDTMLRSYHGAYCIESFDPGVVNWYRKHHPQVIRGQLSCDMGKGSNLFDRIRRKALTNMWANLYTRPDFIAYQYLGIKKTCNQFWRKRLHCMMAAWTLCDQQAFDQAKPDFDLFIFEGFDPK